MIDYRSWFWGIIAWDGLLPIVVIGVSWMAALLLPGAQALPWVVFFLPMSAFFLRATVGIRRISGNHCSSRVKSLQVFTFVLALFILAVFDTQIVIAQMMPNAFAVGGRGELIACAIILIAYLSMVTFAMYPGLTETDASASSNWYAVD